MNFNRMLRLAALVSASFVLISCGGGGDDKGGVVKLQGAGSSFVAPLYLKWFKTYGATHPNVQVDYQSIGSGGGVKSFMDKTVDFAASDAAMKAEDIAKVDGGVQLLPLTAGSIVLAYNVTDAPNLKLSREAYSGIFNGKVTKWNDPLIAKTNAGVKLPNTPINVVVRADSSGTTFVFTKHLSAINKDFEKAVGVNNMPNWPVGTRSKGNEGVTASILTTPGSIGYIEYGYAHSQKLNMASLENKTGKFIEPTIASAAAALASAELPADFIVWVPDPEGADSYPVVSYSWMLLYKKNSDQKKVETLRNLLDYALTDGQKESEALGYVPLPPAVSAKVKAAADSL